MWSFLKLYHGGHIREVILKSLVISIEEDNEGIDLSFAAGYYPISIR
jgi:hypothetical protein